MTGLARLTDYGVDPLTGFVPATPPPDRLPPGFEAWEAIAARLPPLIRSGRIRAALRELEPVDTTALSPGGEAERAFLIATLFANAWVWGGKEPDLVLPASVAAPLCALARAHDRPPILHYAGMALNNWRLLDPRAPIGVDNMHTQVALIGGVDEDWFFIASVGVELAAAPAVTLAHAAAQASLHGDDAGLTQTLQALAEAMEPVIASLSTVRAWCDPDIYYRRVRPWFAGWPDPGVVYQGVGPEPVKYVGGSAGQSSLMQAIDAALGVAHAGSAGAYLNQLRAYMPVRHRRLVTDLERLSQVRARAAGGGGALQEAYNAAIGQTDSFRRRHVGLAQDFIVKPSGPSADQTGTGGTNFIDFLRDTRVETVRARL